MDSPRSPEEQKPVQVTKCSDMRGGGGYSILKCEVYALITYTYVQCLHFSCSEKSDVWSYGVVMWEIFSLGDYPYGKMEKKEVKEYLKQGKRYTF